ncbi:MAG: DUF3185 domain-containing protein [Planctomycetota bacterium]
MNKQSLFIAGILLAVLGAAALGWQKISYISRETVVDIGSVKLTADTTKDLPLSPILGGIALTGGIVLIVMAVKSPNTDALK